MKTRHFRATIFLSICLALPLTASAQVVDVPDSNLRTVIEKALRMAPGDPITQAKMMALNRLDARNANISNLTGLEVAINLTNLNLASNMVSDISRVATLTNLTDLNLANNMVSDLSPVAGLINLTNLNLAKNAISNISPVSGLTNLTALAIDINTVSDISPVSSLINLTALDFQNNTITDISPVTNLTKLVFLVLQNNTISDISPVAGLTNLTLLFLGNNTISDISPLVENTGLGSGDRVDLHGNALNYASIHTHVPTLEERGVEIIFDNRTPRSIRIVSGDDQEGSSGSALASPFIVEVQDGNSVAFEGVPVTFAVTAGGGTLSAANTTTDANGRAESTLTLGPNSGVNTVTVSVTGIQEEPTFNAEGIRTPKAFWIIFGIDQQGLVGEALANPFIVEVRDQSGEPMSGAQVMFSVTAGGGTLSVTTAATDSNGRVESVLTLGPDPGTNTVTVSVTGIEEEQSVSATAEPPPIPEDVNRDDVVNILDLVAVAANLGNMGTDLAADVNGDGVVNILDLVVVAGALGNAAAPASDPRALAMLTAAEVGRWLAQAQTLDLTDGTTQMGVLVLEQLMAALTPEETLLLPNYPNPFNPETWIPYQLSRDAEVTLSIFDANGFMVRRLELGHQLVGYYRDRGKAVYWDGRNDVGERVASGVYFYHLAAGDISATRKMLILK